MLSFFKNYPALAADLEVVQGRILEVCSSSNPLIQEAVKVLFDNQGKMLRPALLIIGSWYGKEPEREKIINLSAALELLHVATLVHDDVIDDAPLRRGNPTVHSRFGQKDAVLVGDFLLSRCFILASEYTSPENARYIARAMSVICSMEIEQDTHRFQPSLSIRSYLRNIIGKTTILFGSALFVGASESKAPRRIQEILRRIGYNLGMAFQIIDDILDYTGEPEVIKKPRGSDLRSGIVTLPLILALHKDKTGMLHQLVAPDRFEKSDPLEIIELCEKLGGIEEARHVAHSYTQRALSLIDTLPPGMPTPMLRELTTQLLYRKY
ncbi:MAG: polyprenyl synthetase family protein [Treponemataceae bacterium]|nr:polyprenyl synthetase family protein [Treponemataceae bacterium]